MEDHACGTRDLRPRPRLPFRRVEISEARPAALIARFKSLGTSLELALPGRDQVIVIIGVRRMIPTELSIVVERKGLAQNLLECNATRFVQLR